MISIIETPQRADFKVEYATDNDILTVTIGDKTEIFDFMLIPEGIAEEITIQVLLVNPIVSVEKIADTINITVIRFYSEAEKNCLRCKMSKIKWKNKSDIDAEKELKEQEKIEKEKFRNKEFKNLSTKEKDKLLEVLAKQIGLI